ncbi:MAG: hypothetical protein HXY30_10705 [Pseudorhodoplanes sp.]|nr:hypothetical protein [Pseudorhodoplanes sp.]
MTLSDRIREWLASNPDDIVLRALFGAMLIGTASVLGLDFAEMQALPAAETPAPAGPVASPSDEPLPPARRGADRKHPARSPDKALSAPMTFELLGDGKLMATGTIVPGTAEAFSAEIDKRGGYVRTVVLHSPGGSVRDALSIGRLIRARKLNTAVESGRYCASSCPLLLAGGVERHAGEKAAIGVHQVSLASDHPLSGATGMENAQRVSAECQRYLHEMGVDPAVWVYAMETPSNELFYFSREDLVSLKLATQPSGRSTTARVSQ